MAERTTVRADPSMKSVCLLLRRKDNNVTVTPIIIIIIIIMSVFLERFSM